MSEYLSWNESIIDYFTSSIPKGRPIFLSLNDSALIEIGVNYMQMDADKCIQQFEACLREEFTRDSRIDFPERDDEGYAKPYYAGFLAGMVLASHRMVEDEETSEQTYFKRLNQLFLEQDLEGRPNGLSTGYERKFWDEWNEWLSKEGWEVTAKEGMGSYRFIQYPISQSLLRDGDINHIKRVFITHLSNQRSNRLINEISLKTWILNNWNFFNRKHLNEGFLSNEISRSSAFFSEAFHLYENMEWKQSNLANNQHPIIRTNKTIRCGIIRTSSNLSGDSEYRILPKKPRGWKNRIVSYRDSSGVSQQLKPFRRGYFEPLSNVDPFINANLEFQVIDDQIERIIFPETDFWVLTKNPNDPNNYFASWNDFDNSLGTKMIILVRGHNELIHDEMNTYREQGLINWYESIENEVNGIKWTEYFNCMVLKNCWDGVIPSPEAEDLYHRLKPALMQYSSINLNGGLRIPEQNSWLLGYLPKIKVFGFEQTFDIDLIKDGRSLGIKKIETQTEYSICEITSEELNAGTYKIIARHNNYFDELIFNVIEWDELNFNQNNPDIENYLFIEESTFKTMGPFTEELN